MTEKLFAVYGNADGGNTAEKNGANANSAAALVDVLEKISSNPVEENGATPKVGLQDGKETISDDFDLDEASLQKIIEQEELVRGMLTLFDVNYDELVRMDGKSVYSQAVSSNPEVLDYVKNSTNPVLEAVKIALNFQPYADFVGKYGNEPESIKKAIRAEVEAEMQTAKQKKSEEKTRAARKGVPFSNDYSVNANRKEKRGERKELAEIFGR